MSYQDAGKIYKVVNSENDKVYIGSTVNTLKNRLAGHRAESKVHNTSWYKAMRRIGCDKFSIELVKDFPCENRMELEAEERKTIRKFLKDGVKLYNTLMTLLIEFPLSIDPTSESTAVIALLESDPVMLDEVMKWVVASGHDKRYKRCIAELSEDCLKADAADLFHGKHCAECRAVYQRDKYQERKSKNV